jgi:septation ring formation regulator
MDKTLMIVILLTIYFVGIGAIIATLFIMRNKKKKGVIKEINLLERDKNSIINSVLITEFNKVESLINNKKLQEKYDAWQEKLSTLKDQEMPKVTDILLNAEELMDQGKFEEALRELSKAEMEIYYVKTKTNFLLEDIRKITLSEERNREAVTKLKSIYREIVMSFNENKNEYSEVTEAIELQFETVDKLFSTFEVALEKREYEEIGKIVKALRDLIQNLKVVIEESPNIILMGRILIPKKMSDIKAIYSKLTRDGYNLDYLNLEYNIDEVSKKLTDIFDRLKLLNVEDSIFELKTVLDYFESLFSDFDKERLAKRIYDKVMKNTKDKIDKLISTIKNLSLELKEIKDMYNLTEEETNVIKEIHSELISIKEEYKVASDRTRIKENPYSKITKECEIISVKLSKVEDKLEATLKNLSSLKEDELRAREQLDDIKKILKDSKRKITSYKLPVIPKNYYVEMEEAIESIKELKKELETKPISIKVLNTRVDTARDLVLKFYMNCNEIIKSASLAESIMVFANRYRVEYKEVDSELEKSEKQFHKGEYRNSLEKVLKVLNDIEPGITDQLLETYKK